MKTLLFILGLFSFNILFGQTKKPAVYYCIDHPGKTVFFNSGQAVVKQGLQKAEYYQYGFMKWKGWINKSWEGLEYDVRFLPAANAKKKGVQITDSLTRHFSQKGYAIQQVPMPYPMKPFSGYRKDGKN